MRKFITLFQIVKYETGFSVAPWKSMESEQSGRLIPYTLTEKINKNKEEPMT